MPDYGKILAYRSTGGFGIRLDGGMGYAGAVITPFYDSLLVKVIASAHAWDLARHRMDRALREFRIRGLKTNIPFLENVINNPIFAEGRATTTLVDNTPELYAFKPRRDRATKLLNFLGNVIVNGNPHAKGYKPAKVFELAKAAGLRLAGPHPQGHARSAAGTRAEEVRGVGGQAESACSSPTPPSAMRTSRSWPRACAPMTCWPARRRSPAGSARWTTGLFSLEMWGGATFDTAMRFLSEDPWERLRQLRAAIPNICFQMLFRGSNAVGYSNYPDNVVAGFVKHAAASGMDIFRIFDSLNYLPNLRVAMEAVQDTHAICEAAICYTGDILDERRDKYSLKYYVRTGPGTGKGWAPISWRSRTWPGCAGLSPRASWSRR